MTCASSYVDEEYIEGFSYFFFWEEFEAGRLIKEICLVIRIYCQNFPLYFK